MNSNTLKCTSFIAFFLSTTTITVTNSAWAMDINEECPLAHSQKQKGVIFAEDEIEKGSVFGKVLKDHLEAARQNPAHITKIKRELLPTLTGANEIYHSDTLPKVLDTDEQLVNGESNRTLFNRAKQDLIQSDGKMPSGWFKHSFIDPVKMSDKDPRINKPIFFKKPHLAARLDNLLEPEVVNAQRFEELVKGAVIVRDATQLDISGISQRSEKVTVYYTDNYSIDTQLFLEGQGFVVVQESFSDDENIQGGPQDGVVGTQQEPFVFSNPELLPAATVLRAARATLPDSMPCSNGKGVKMGLHEIHAYTTYVTVYNGKFEPVQPAAQKPAKAILVEGASVDCRPDGNKPQDLTEYALLVAKKRNNVMKVGASMADKVLPKDVKRVFSSGLPGLGVFENDVTATVNATRESLCTYGGYFDFIVFAGLSDLKPEETLKLETIIQEKSENSSTENRNLVGRAHMIEMLVKEFGAEKLSTLTATTN